MSGDILGKILIIKLSALGDVIMSLPALEALKRKYPTAAIDWLVEAPAAGLLLGHPSLNRVLISPRHQLRNMLKTGRFLEGYRLFQDFKKELRAVNYDAVLDLQGLFKSGLNMGLSRGQRKVGFDRGREMSHWFLNEKMPPYDPERHAALRYLDAAVHLGADWPELPLRNPYYTPGLAGEKEADELIGHLKNSFVVINPGTRRASKCWPISHWQELTKLIITKANLAVVITGSKDEAQTGDELAVTNLGVINLCGRTSLPGLAAILARPLAMITGDTGPMHLAAAVGGGGLALFGPTKSSRTGPFGGHFTILTPPRECIGCLKRQCDRICLSLLEPLTVWEQLQAFIQPKL